MGWATYRPPSFLPDQYKLRWVGSRTKRNELRLFGPEVQRMIFRLTCRAFESGIYCLSASAPPFDTKATLSTGWAKYIELWVIFYTSHSSTPFLIDMGDSPAYRIVGPPEGNQRTANKRTTGNDILKARGGLLLRHFILSHLSGRGAWPRARMLSVTREIIKRTNITRPGNSLCFDEGSL